MPLDPHELPFSWFRVLLIGATLVGCYALWRRPRAGAAVALILGLNLAAWFAYTAPLGRLYGLQEHIDRGFNVGMAAVAAAGNSPFEHTQVRFGNLEPFWSALVAALAFYRPERVMPLYHWLSPLSLVLVTLGLYLGLRTGEGEDDAWERALVVLAVLGLSSFSLSQHGPVPPLWAANFLYKPNHAMGWALVGLVLGSQARGRSGWTTGLLLGLLAWVFLLDWAFLGFSLVVGTLLGFRRRADFARLALALVVSGVLAAPYIAHLARYYSPVGRGGSSAQIWLDSMGQRLAPPHWATLDLGPLFVLGVAGAVVLKRRGTRRDVLLLGVLVSAWLLWLGYQAGSATAGFSPEPEEQHYFLRFSMALAAGAALAAIARHLEESWRLRTGQGPALVLAACLPLTFPAYWDPPTMDRYYRWDVQPIKPKVLDYGRWVGEHTPPDAVFAAGPSACMWIPILAGRRVLLAEDSRPPSDLAARQEAQRILFFSRDSALIAATARQFGVDYIAIDQEMVKRHGDAEFEGLGRLPVYQPAYLSSAIRILRIRRTSDGSVEGRKRREVPYLPNVQEQRLEEQLDAED
jgi:hypothetical protein